MKDATHMTAKRVAAERGRTDPTLEARHHLGLSHDALLLSFMFDQLGLQHAASDQRLTAISHINLALHQFGYHARVTPAEAG